MALAHRRIRRGAGSSAASDRGCTTAWKRCSPRSPRRRSAVGRTVIMIFLGAFFTALGVYDRLGRVAGGGSIIPITGFANSVVSPALEFNREGVFFGVCAKMFVIAGPSSCSEWSPGWSWVSSTFSCEGGMKTGRQSFRAERPVYVRSSYTVSGTQRGGRRFRRALRHRAFGRPVGRALLRKGGEQDAPRSGEGRDVPRGRGA